MSDITLRLAEACERAARTFDFLANDILAVTKEREQDAADAVSFRALAAALRGAKPTYLHGGHASEYRLWLPHELLEDA